MSTLINQDVFLSRRKRRRYAMLQRMAAMRAAKERKRLDGPYTYREPKMKRWHRFEIGLRDKVTGEVAWHDLKSVRHASIAFRLVLQAERERSAA